MNPIQNPYVVGEDVLPPAGRRFLAAERSAPQQQTPDGVIREGDVVTRAFARIGWMWGGTYREPDYQNFSAA
ncbi:M15 family metallopeptidase [Motilibacter sp. K478]|nr:M15 family metallopeptidase [Motilibacter aurantiacus]